MRFEVDSERVAQASASVHTSTGVIRTEVAAMMRHLQDLQTSWHGSAATSFAGVMAQWQSAQTQVEAALDSVTAALRSASVTYADAENQATRLFSAR